MSYSNFTLSVISRPWHEYGEMDRRRPCTSIVSSLQVRLMFTENLLKCWCCVFCWGEYQTSIFTYVWKHWFLGGHISVTVACCYAFDLLLKHLRLVGFGFCTSPYCYFNIMYLNCLTLPWTRLVKVNILFPCRHYWGAYIPKAGVQTGAFWDSGWPG